MQGSREWYCESEIHTMITVGIPYSSISDRTPFPLSLEYCESGGGGGNKPTMDSIITYV